MPRSHKGSLPENEKADKWVKLAADEPDVHGAEFLGYSDRYGRRRSSRRTLAHLKRLIIETKWQT